MKITFIGCGDAFSIHNGNNSALVELEKTNLMIDIPDSNYGRIGNLGIEYSDIDHLFITHLHGDHINGLERFAYYRKFATPIVKPEKANKKTVLYIADVLYDGLWDSVKNGLGITTEGFLTLEDYFEVVRIDTTTKETPSFTIEGTSFQLIGVNHVPTMPVFGLYAENHFYYSADSTFDENHILTYLPTVKCFFHDMHFFSQELTVHASYRDFVHLSEEQKDKIFAMHYDDSHRNTSAVEGIKLVPNFYPITV